MTDAPRQPQSRIGLGALIQVEEDDVSSWWLMLPDGGGRIIEVGGQRVTVVSPASPVGKEVMGLEEDDEVELWLGGRDRTLTISSVR